MRGARRLLLVALAAVMTVAVLPGQAVAEKTLGISATNFEFNLAEGQTAEGELTIMNDGDEPIEVLVYAMDQKVDDKGNVSFAAPDMNAPNAAASPASWMAVSVPASTKSIGNIPYVAMKPGDRFPVSFEMQIPKGTPPGDHQVILFFEIMANAELEGTGATTSGRLGSRITVRVQGDITEKLDAAPFVLRQFVVGDDLPYTFVLVNDGNVDRDVTGVLVLLDGNETEKFRSDVVTDTTVYAGTSAERSGVAQVGSLLGRYAAQLVIESPREGDGAAVEQIIKKRTVWVIPLWLAISVVVVLGGLALWASWRLAVRSASKRAAHERMELRRKRGLPADDDQGAKSALDDRSGYYDPETGD